MTGLRERCEQVLEGSWTVGERDGVPFAYTRPSPERYRWQWYWDSCFAAIGWRHIDPARSRAELETLLGAARPDGFIGPRSSGSIRSAARGRCHYNVIHHDDAMTATIEPSALAFAWRLAIRRSSLGRRSPHGHHRRAGSRGRRVVVDLAAGRLRVGRLAPV